MQGLSWASCKVWNGMEWNRGMELWNGMEWVFGMVNYGMKILSNAFGVRVKTVISWDERGHSHDNSYC